METETQTEKKEHEKMQEEVKQTYLDAENLREKNERLTVELNLLKKNIAEKEEKEKALAHLEILVGSKNDPLYERAMRKGEEQQELQNLSYDKKYEMGYLLCLGEEGHERKKNNSFTDARVPSFARSGGNGQVASFPMKTPTNFEMARENAKKYFGGR